MAPSKVKPVTAEEILAVFSGENPQPLSANEVATSVWISRGQGTPEVASRHTKPVLDRMAADGTLHVADGRDEARAIGRTAAARHNIAYYHLADRAKEHLRTIEENKQRATRVETMARMLREHHADLLTNVYPTFNGLRLQLTYDQAKVLWDILAQRRQDQSGQSSE